MSDLVELVESIRRSVPTGVALTSATSIPEGVALLPNEHAAAQGMSETRRREFHLGRLAARHALAELGIESPDGIGTDGPLPIWPAGAVGSISHRKFHALAMAGRSPHFLGLGVDLELVEESDTSLVTTIVLDEERAHFSRPEAPEASEVVGLFCAKEASFKALYSKFMLRLSWKDICVDRQGDRFVARSQLHDLPSVEGVLASAACWRAAAAWIAQKNLSV